MIGRRGLFGGLAAMAGGRWLGGDPGTGRGSGIRGGLPGPRADQQYRPPGPPGPVGSSNNVVKARILITYGTGETGLFQYNGNPSFGNPPELWAVPPGVTHDPYRNALPASGGIATLGPGGELGQLAGGFLALTNNLNVSSGFVSAPSGFGGLLQLQSPSTGSGDHVAGVGLFSKNGASTSQPYLALNNTGLLAGSFPPATAALVEIKGDLALTEQSSAPPTPAGAGVFYVDSTGHLHYKGPLGTDTTLAPP